MFDGRRLQNWRLLQDLYANLVCILIDPNVIEFLYGNNKIASPHLEFIPPKQNYNFYCAYIIRITPLKIGFSQTKIVH